MLALLASMLAFDAPPTATQAAASRVTAQVAPLVLAAVLAASPAAAYAGDAAAGKGGEPRTRKD